MTINGGPNPIITPWKAPPWETPDIWFDSEKNGWNKYRYSDPSGNPVGNGDNLWLNHENRIYIRIRNIGHADATEVKVRVYYTQNPNIGDNPSAWMQIGTITYALIEVGKEAVNYIQWRPTDNVHTCIKAVIEESPSYEDNHFKVAQENVTIFETSMTASWEPIHVKSQIYNPLSKPVSVNLNVANVPDDWAIEFDSSHLSLEINQKLDMNVTLYPTPPNDIPGDSPRKSDKYQVGYIAKPRIEALVPFNDTFVLLGGIETWVHLVEKSTVRCDSVKVTSNSVVVRGNFKPTLEGSNIAVEIRGESDKRDISFVAVDADGNYIAEFKVPTSGSWIAKAFFDGNDRISSSESNEYEFSV